MNAKMNEHSPYPQGNHCPLEGETSNKLEALVKTKETAFQNNFSFLFAGNSVLQKVILKR